MKMSWNGLHRWRSFLCAASCSLIDPGDRGELSFGRILASRLSSTSAYSSITLLFNQFMARYMCFLSSEAAGEPLTRNGIFGERERVFGLIAAKSPDPVGPRRIGE